MNKLDETDKHQEIVSKTIKEFQKRDELLNEYSKQFSEITSVISDLESELIVWQKEKEDLQKNPVNQEEVETWQNQINSIENNIKDKRKELETLQEDIDEFNLEVDDLSGKIAIIESEQIEYIINTLQDQQGLSDNHWERLISDLNLLKDLWKVQGKDYDLNKFVKFFKSKNIEIDFKLLNELFDESIEFFIPSIVTEFLNSYLADFNFKNIADANCQIGSLLFQIELSENTNLTAFVDKSEDEEVINLIHSNKNVNFEINLDEFQENSENQFDIVFGITNNTQNELINWDDISDNKENISFLRVASKLSKEGIAFCILNPELRLNWEDTSIFSNLGKYDLYINAIIRLSSEIFPKKDSTRTLLLIKKNKPETIFVGELNNSSKEILLENIKKRKSGKIPQHGILTDIESFYSFSNLLAKTESEYFASATGLEPLKFKDIVNYVFSSNKFSETSEDFNYIFLPVVSNANAVLSSQEFKLKPENYFQIFFDPEKVLADYAARFYNTKLGKKIRESISTVTSIPRINKKSLLESELYLPNLDNQIDIVSVDSLITELTTRANSNKLKLWNSPLKVADIQKEINDMDDGKSEEKFEQWIESLPYPLASILWCSVTNPIYERKVKYLLHFFEAFSEFNMALLLSGLSSDEKFFQTEVTRCFRDDSRFRNWYFKPTFGNWYKFGSCLSKTVRRLLEENKHKCLEVFGNPDPEFLLKIAHKDLVTIFEEVSNYRNQWEGHGPVVSEKEYQNRYKILRSVLSRVYQILSDAYENTFLILPLQSSFEDGVHNYSIRRYMSTRAPFKPDNIETVKLMDKSKIYLAHENQRKPVELLPFVINLDGACYFYNGRDYESGQARYVSYHYHKKPEIHLPMDGLNQVISLLKP
ncbi:restriction endonuclease subunit S domain-containing protein [Methanobacterium formicicum]|uniref:Uncharacterized protein n=1 Tax=Methanobacterium formicicum TaxID=2162 RepID=A0A0S4FP58_METFO|nr:hypothetical protein [Methanobacterium formicicum]CEL24792.1 hypothetical protein MB9_1154 [Methanobacterium formicicum]